jgi:GNAT superfamily N-acetyltransferase
MRLTDADRERILIRAEELGMHGAGGALNPWERLNAQYGHFGDYQVPDHRSHHLLYKGQKIGELWLGPGKRFRSVELEKIEIDKAHRGHGHAKGAMQQLVAMADANGYTLVLTPEDYWGSDVDRLRLFYMTFGFQNRPGRRSMIRRPVRTTR